MRKLGLSLLIFAAVLVTMPSPAAAGGLFYAGSGTRALGRGAAFHVRADDPMALMYNPARLADLQGTQFLANFNLALLDACFDPAGTADETGGPLNPSVAGQDNGPGSQAAGWRRDQGTYIPTFKAGGDADVTRFGVVPKVKGRAQRKTWLGTTMPQVCNETGLLPIPNFVLTKQFFNTPALAKHGLTIAFGMVAPGAVAKTTWGGTDGTVRATRHATAAEVRAAVGDGDDLGKRLPAGVRPDAVCDPSKDDCSMYCDPEKPPVDTSTCTQWFCDPSKYDCDKLPTPTRHMLVQQDPFAIPLTLGVGYRPLPWLAVGGAFTYQAMFVKNTVYGVQGKNVTPESDMKIENKLNDYFVPVVNVSTQITPFQGLDFMAYYKWQDKIQADTQVTITDGVYSNGGSAGRLPVKTTIKAGEGIVTTVPQPWEMGLGVRFGLLRGGNFTMQKPDPRLDAMTTEWFDLEFDFVLEHNSSVKQFELKTKENPFKIFNGYDGDDDPNNPKTDPLDPNCSKIPGQKPDASSRCTTQLTFLKRMSLNRNWQDQYVFRVGGDVNVIPGVLALRTGYNYETRGVTPALQSIDAFPSKRQGIHFGLTWRVGKFDISAAYAHLFQEQIRVLPYGLAASACTSDADCKPRKDSAQLSASSPEEGAVPVNAGTYNVKWDVFSLGMTQRF